MISAVVTTKGRIVIPFQIRRKFKIKRGTRFSIEEKGGRIILQPLTEDSFEKMVGILNIKGKGVRALLEERAKEKE